MLLDCRMSIAWAVPRFTYSRRFLVSPELVQTCRLRLPPHSQRIHAIMASPSRKSAQDFLAFVNASPTPFHAVRSARLLLEAAGFKHISERDPWSSALEAGGKYYTTRNGSSIVAFAIGKKWRPGNPIGMIGAHTDSCCLRVKPVSKKQSDGFLQVGVETYGGGLWHTWFDRDLGIAGRVMVRTSEGSVRQELVHVQKPILRIPTLAIHLDRQETFAFNRETQLFPIAGLVAAELNRKGPPSTLDPDEQSKKAMDSVPQDIIPLKPMTERHHPFIVELVAKEAQVDPADVLDFELVLYDTQDACIGGINEELIFSARLDNLMMSFCATEGLIRSLSSPTTLENDPTIRLISLFDHEEIGSLSAQGANSNMLPAILRRLSAVHFPPGSTSSDGSYDKLADDSPTAYEQTLASSFLISADMAHSVHPNYPTKYDSEHRPEMNKGTVLKINANVRYATSSPGIVLLQEVAKRAQASVLQKGGQTGVPLQLFVVRNDSSCGSTIGPMLSAALGARTVDLGNAQLSMHSIRETAGVHDVKHSNDLFASFFIHFGELEKTIIVD